MEHLKKKKVHCIFLQPLPFPAPSPPPTRLLGHVHALNLETSFSALYGFICVEPSFMKIRTYSVICRFNPRVC